MMTTETSHAAANAAAWCETILDQVEQEVLIWDDLANPEAAPVRYDPGPDPF
jgi:hypothetical protein